MPSKKLAPDDDVRHLSAADLDGLLPLAPATTESTARAKDLTALGESLLLGVKGMKQAVLWYRRSATLGNKVGQFRLGAVLGKGKGVPRQLDEAFKWFLRSAQQNHPPACFQVGQAYLLALGVLQDKCEAVHWYTRAAELGNLDACLAMAACAEYGRGMPCDLDKALEWMAVASRVCPADRDMVHKQMAVGTLRIIMKKQSSHVRALVETGLAGPYPAVE
ncbi:hypothetical protein GGF32_000688 [Allomyces javanicus]|nr:hypothetical protein GGF32_000688 [Allomyces javanicus]